MSTEANIELLERAQEMIDYFENELPARVIARDIEANDLEALRAHVTEAEATMGMQEEYDLLIIKKARLS